MSARLFTALRRDNRGAALIELALAAPVMAALLIGMSDLARAYSLKLLLEQASQRTIEQVEQQKSVVAGGYNTALSAEAASAMTDAGYSTGNTVTPDSWLECSSNGTTWAKQSSFSGACGQTDTTARYVKVTISRSFVPMFASRAWPGADSNGNITISGTAEVRVQ
jgi:Flp pilus assembly protein TadG